LSAPFILGYAVGKLIVFIFDKVLTVRDRVEQLIGNYLMKQSMEFKEGKIQNPYCIRNYTAHLAYDMLKDEGVI
jgi:2-hydroxy-3-keto-5-methylthiopentenyl-1-phosphate phosphatase